MFDLCAQAFGFEQLIDLQQQLVRVTRLGEVIDCPALHRLDRALDRAMAGEHDDRTAPLFGIHLAQELHPIHHRHLEVSDDHVKSGPVEQPQGLTAIAGGVHRITLALQDFGLRLGHVDFVFD